MPYKSKAEDERERWMTLPEAVSHICSCRSAATKTLHVRQIIKALADGVQVLGAAEMGKRAGRSTSTVWIHLGRNSY